MASAFLCNTLLIALCQRVNLETELFSSAMNRPSISASVGVLMSVGREEEIPSNNLSLRGGIQSVFDEDECVVESETVCGKKRRLRGDQVKALEKYFDFENKLEPERKVKLARELGLRPRQVTVWFQNRRARWKSKQLERDYGDLKANYDALKLDFDTLRRDNEVLLEEIKGAKAKLMEEVMLEESTAPFTDIPFPSESKSADLNCQSFNSNNNGGELGYEISFFATDLKDRSFDESDSSAIVNDECVRKASISSSEALHNNQQLAFSSHGSSLNCFQLQKAYEPHLCAKMEEHNVCGGEEDCTLFSTDQAPILQWCYQDEWD